MKKSSLVELLDLLEKVMDNESKPSVVLDALERVIKRYRNVETLQKFAIRNEIKNIKKALGGKND